MGTGTNVAPSATATSSSIAASTLHWDGNRTDLYYPGGEWVHYAYDADNRVTAITATHAGGGSLFNRTLAYTNAGGADTGLVQTITGTGAATFTYDPHNRLKTETAGGATTTYGYDPAGNRTSVALGASTTYFGFNNADQLCWSGTTSGVTPVASCPATPPVGDNATVNDADGNQTTLNSYVTGVTATYDSADRTTSMAQGGNTVTMTYAGLGQAERTAATGTTFTNGLEGVASQTSSGSSIYFTRDPQGTLISMRQGAGGTSTNDYYLLDQQHSVMALTASDGVTDDATYAYDPWGILSSETGTLWATNRFWWQGAYEATAQLYKLGARYYNQITGAFTQTDPSGQEANPYAYAGNDPINAIDPGGLCSDTPDDEDGGVTLQFCRAVSPITDFFQYIDDYPVTGCGDAVIAGAALAPFREANPFGAADSCAEGAVAGVVASIRDLF